MKIKQQSNSWKGWENFPYWLQSFLSQLENVYGLIGNMFIKWFSTPEKKTKIRGHYQLLKYFSVGLRGIFGDCWTCNNQRMVFVVGKKMMKIRAPTTPTTKQVDWPLEMVNSSACTSTNGCLLLQDHQQCNHHHNPSMLSSHSCLPLPPQGQNKATVWLLGHMPTLSQMKQ